MSDEIHFLRATLSDAKLSPDAMSQANRALDALERQLMSAGQRQLAELRDALDEAFERAIDYMPLLNNDTEDKQALRAFVELARLLRRADARLKAVMCGTVLHSS